MTIEAHTSLASRDRPLGRDLLGSLADAVAPAPQRKQARWFALDVFRALAVLWMIQGHTFTALLRRNDFLPGGFGQLYRMLHGLTAPMFLCGAGLSYGIVMFNDDKPAASGRIVRRALMLLLIGTALQLPTISLFVLARRRDYQLIAARPAALQLVAACLLLAELLRVATGARRGRFASVAGLVGIAIAALAPFIWNAGLSTQFVLGGWLDGESGAQFPFVPWVCFFLMGAVLSSLWGQRLWLSRWRAPAIGCVGLGLSGLCYWQYLSGERLQALYGEHSFWHTSPMFVGFRAGLVLAWLGALSAASDGIAGLFKRLPSCARAISALSRHSLVAYVVHLVLLYGSPFSRGIRRLRPSWDVAECSTACVLVLLVSILFVMHWERLREWLSLSLRLVLRTLQPAWVVVRGPRAPE